ncbi:MAG: DUF4468 domain-containing protein [Tannerellaceae bacterium]|nr:DUF4468 domain-containing protein [Tannerellaceae bacterium]
MKLLMFGLSKKRQFALLLSLLIPSFLFAGNEGNTCSPVKEGKICYTDEVKLNGSDRAEVFQAFHQWAKKEYGKDVFLSNVSENRSKGTLLISTKIELLLTDEVKTQVKYKLYITCDHNKYTIEARNIKYIYEPELVKRYRTFAAEDVIMDGGKANQSPLIADPQLFCEGTHFYFTNLFAEIYRIISESIHTN